MKPTFFSSPAELRAWLEQHHVTATELLVGLYKRGSGKPSITWPELVDSLVSDDGNLVGRQRPAAGDAAEAAGDADQRRRGGAKPPPAEPAARIIQWRAGVDPDTHLSQPGPIVTDRT